jgi:hypothetical protein
MEEKILEHEGRKFSKSVKFTDLDVSQRANLATISGYQIKKFGVYSEGRVIEKDEHLPTDKMEIRLRNPGIELIKAHLSGKELSEEEVKIVERLMKLFEK